MWLTLSFALLCVVGFVILVMKRGHVQAWTDIFVFSILSVLAIIGSSLELLRIVNSYTLKLGRKKLFPPGSGPRKHRRIVVFDGICVLCNRFGAFVHGRLLDPSAVDWVPFQDKENEHVDVDAVVKEFDINPAHLQDRICVVSGKKMYWGADAVIEICQWCKWPYPLAALGLLVPHAFRDSLYCTVAQERYKWFGTQPLDQNFAKYLCPYFYINKKAFEKKEKGKMDKLKGKEADKNLYPSKK
ncbi:hypothetical protein AAMO2058_001078900 [Amorphochlora amoebiformis]|mmetsp:Transcript_22666/g.35596  ORF Transcript_22666/g.35596 Transcript_22666/m.35596 type:complete len:243 (-) Transcript_22666:159-887(-)